MNPPIEISKIVVAGRTIRCYETLGGAPSINIPPAIVLTEFSSF